MNGDDVSRRPLELFSSGVQGCRGHLIGRSVNVVADMKNEALTIMQVALVGGVRLPDFGFVDGALLVCFYGFYDPVLIRLAKIGMERKAYDLSRCLLCGRERLFRRG